MDATSFFVLAGLVLLGGPLAYFADQLGRKLGKKRLSIFGLRPRHTATFLTVSAGILIPFITVLAMLGLSKGVRDWVLEGSHALAQRKLLIAENDRLVTNFRSVTDAVNAQNTKLQGLEARYKIKLGQSKVLEDSIRKLTRGLETQRKALTRREADVRRLSLEVSKRTKAIAAINIQLQERQFSLSKANLELAVTNKDLANVKHANGILSDEYKTLDKERTKLRGQIDKLTPEVQDLKNQREDQKRLLEQETALLEAAKIKVADLEQRERDAEERVASVLGVISPKLRQPIIYPADAEIVRMSVPPGLSQDEARRLIESMLGLARVEAAKKGAEANETTNVAGLAHVSSPVPMTPLEVESTLIRRITNLQSEGLLLAYTPVNVFKTEPVELVVNLRPNPLVYHQGQTISSTRIDGKQDTDTIFQRLQSFISSDVIQKAIAADMIPRVGQDTSLGEITTRRYFEVVDAIRTEGRTVTVLALAKVDTHAGDFLQLDFKVVK